jgi:phosphoglycolate phosphatase-like HAD superfamily hydrolase
MSKEVEDLLQLVRIGGYRNLVFDLDETITRLELPWDEWIQEVAATLPPARAKEFVYAIDHEGVAWGSIINQQIKTDKAFYQKYLQICKAFEAKHCAHTPYADLVDALPKLHDMGARLMLWTANTRPTAERALLELGVLHLFTRLLTREDTLFGKPHTEGWSLLKTADQPVESFLFIGDSKNDEQAARAGNVRYYQIRFFKE